MRNFTPTFRRAAPGGPRGRSARGCRSPIPCRPDRHDVELGCQTALDRVAGLEGAPLRRAAPGPARDRELVMYLLDTNACIRVLNGTSAPVTRLRSRAASEIRVSSSPAELVYGAPPVAPVAENLRLLASFSRRSSRCRSRCVPEGTGSAVDLLAARRPSAPTTFSSRPPRSPTTSPCGRTIFASSLG